MKRTNICVIERFLTPRRLAIVVATLTACSQPMTTVDVVTPLDTTTAPQAFTVEVAAATIPSTGVPTTAPAPTTTQTTAPVIENSGPISIHEDEDNGSFHVELSPSTTGAVRDAVVSWAMVSRADFRTSAARIADERAAALAAAVTAPTVPGEPTLVPPTSPPPPPPPPPPLPVTFEAHQVGSPVTPGEVRVEVTQQLGTPEPVSWSVAFIPDVEGQAVLSSAIISVDAREAFDAALRAELGDDATEWKHPPGIPTTRDITFDAHGNLVARLPSWLSLSQGQAKVKLPIDSISSMISPIGQRIINGQPAYPATPDCAVDPCIAISYDDGPSPYTSALLDHLDLARAPATFFMIGKAIEKLPDEAREVAERGYQIGNHTWSHPRLGDLDFGTQAGEVQRTQQLIEDVAGANTDMLRPPYGSYNDDTRYQNLALMFWNVDTDDWNHRDPAQTVRNALEQVRPGSVILMHDLHEASVLATPYLIASLRALGYSIVSLDVLFPAREAGAMYRGADEIEPPLPPTTLPPPPPPPPTSPPIPPGTNPANAPATGG